MGEIRDRFEKVVDATTDTRREAEKRQYLYVLSQSDELIAIGDKYLNERSNLFSSFSQDQRENWLEKNYLNQLTWNVKGFPIAGDRIDVYDEGQNGRRIFNM